MEQSLRERIAAPEVAALVAQTLEAPGGPVSAFSPLVALARLSTLVDQPAWRELERADVRAQAVLAHFARLGPEHAALSARYLLLGPVLLALMVGADPDPAAALVRIGQKTLATASRNAWQAPDDFLSARHGRASLSRAALIGEGSGTGRLAHRLQRRRLASDLNDLASATWAFLEQNLVDLPTLIFRRPGDDLEVGAVGQFIRGDTCGDRVFVNVERAALANVVRNHRQLGHNGVSDAEIARYEPCARFAPILCADPPGLVLLHELIHAAVSLTRERYAPRGRHRALAAGVARAARRAGWEPTDPAEISIAGALVTVRRTTGPISDPEDWIAVRGTILLDEALTEALTHELAPGLVAAAPDLFVAPARLWAGRLQPAASSYAEGVYFLTALLGTGVSVRPFLFGPGRVVAFRRALRWRLSAEAATRLERAIYGSDGAGLLNEELDPVLRTGDALADASEEELIFGAWRQIVEADHLQVASRLNR